MPLAHLRSRVDTNLPRVLVVDDEPMNIFALQLMLQEFGFSCDQADGGKSALQAVQSRVEKYLAGEARMYELILMDYCMPDMDGPETTRRIQEIYRSNQRLQASKLPIICCCTAYTEATFM